MYEDNMFYESESNEELFTTAFTSSQPIDSTFINNENENPFQGDQSLLTTKKYIPISALNKDDANSCFNKGMSNSNNYKTNIISNINEKNQIKSKQNFSAKIPKGSQATGKDKEKKEEEQGEEEDYFKQYNAKVEETVMDRYILKEFNCKAKPILTDFLKNFNYIYVRRLGDLISEYKERLGKKLFTKEIINCLNIIHTYLDDHLECGSFEYNFVFYFNNWLLKPSLLEDNCFAEAYASLFKSTVYELKDRIDYIDKKLEERIQDQIRKKKSEKKKKTKDKYFINKRPPIPVQAHTQNAPAMQSYHFVTNADNQWGFGSGFKRPAEPVYRNQINFDNTRRNFNNNNRNNNSYNDKNHIYEKSSIDKNKNQKDQMYIKPTNSHQNIDDNSNKYAFDEYSESYVNSESAIALNQQILRHEDNMLKRKMLAIYFYEDIINLAATMANEANYMEDYKNDNESEFLKDEYNMNRLIAGKSEVKLNYNSGEINHLKKDNNLVMDESLILREVKVECLDSWDLQSNQKTYNTLKYVIKQESATENINCTS